MRFLNTTVKITAIYHNLTNDTISFTFRVIIVQANQSDNQLCKHWVTWIGMNMNLGLYYLTLKQCRKINFRSTHLPIDKAALSQTTFSNAFSWMKMYSIRLNFTEVYSQWSNYGSNIPALVEIMPGHRPGDKPLFQPMLTRFTDIYAALGGDDLPGKTLTHWGWDEMSAILQTFLNSFSCMDIMFWWKFHLNLFQRNNKPAAWFR